MEGEQIMWDTDWYKVIDVGEGELHWSAVCDFWSTMVIMDAGSGDCSDFSTIAWGSADACDTARMVEYVSGGTYWLWIAPVTQTTPCPSDYVTWVECVPANNCCDVDMVPDNYPISVPPGGSFGLTGFVSNPTPNPIITDVWVGVIYQYLFYQIWDFPNIALNPGQGVNAHLNQYVPGYAPAGSYEYIAYCGDYPDNICDSVRFDFTVTGGRIDGGADEWTLKGRFEAVDTPSEFALKNSHPNPFNATTTITYDVPLAGIVTLDVFNLMGQKVAILVDGKVEAGQHSVTWDAENYSSGIYFYKLTAGGKTFNKRMTLLK